KDHAQADDEPEVPHAVGDERLHRGVGGVLLVEVETYEQVRAEANELPENKKEKQAVGEQEAEHRKTEQREVTKEAVELALMVNLVTVAGHVADAEDMDPGRDERHHEKHDDGEP